MEDDRYGWGANGGGGGGPFLQSFITQGGGTEGGVVLGIALVGTLCGGGMGGGGPLGKTGLESGRNWNCAGTGGGG